MNQESPRARAIAEEQAFVDAAYGALDYHRKRYEQRLAAVRSQSGLESAGERSERDSFAQHYEENLTRLKNVENRLVLGRLDFHGGRTDHIGRIGLKDANQEILLLDWRAPQSEPFYRATAAHPGNVRRRRHIQTRFREVTAVDDELMDGSAANSDLTFTGEGALMAAMGAARDGKMNDIVATIQAEQDQIIRSDAQGVLVVQGGPGTGKTAVALHRAAYLLYTMRDRLSRSGVLIIGPSPVFLRYIDQVLPALGESDVVSTTIGGLLPGVEATGVDGPDVAELKGRIVWRTIARRAVKEILEKPLHRPVRFRVGGNTVVLKPADVDGAQRKARRGGRSHNESRDVYAKALVRALAQQIASAEQLDLTDNPWIISDVAASVDARREINLHWLPSSAQSLLERLWAHPHLLARVAPELTAAERALLRRPKGVPLTPGDVAIMDEMAEYLGPFYSTAELVRRRREKEANAEVDRYARETVEKMHLGGGIVSAEMLADRMRDTGGSMSLADRAAGDRTWTYGHVVVDEAQELTPMQWQMLIRRNPSRSMTVVGDVDQRPSGAPDGGWKKLMGPLARGARVQELTVSYRTPAAILATAERTLRAAGYSVRPVHAARDVPGTQDFVPTAALLPSLIEAVVAGGADMDGAYGTGLGTLALIVPAAIRDAVADAVMSAPELAGWTRDVTGRQVTARVQVLTARQAKGLEYDWVVLAEPDAILREGPGDLYVALTRPTRHLRVVHTRPLPSGMKS